MIHTVKFHPGAVRLLARSLAHPMARPVLGRAAGMRLGGKNLDIFSLIEIMKQREREREREREKQL